MVRIENNRDMLDITIKIVFLSFLMLFCSIFIQVVQTWFIWPETRHTIVFSIYYCAEMFRFENNSHILDIMFKVAFLRFLI